MTTPNESGTIADCAAKSGELDLGNNALMRVGASLVERGQITEALPMFERCGQASERAGDYESLALALCWCSASASILPDFEQARRYADRGIRAAQHADSRFAEYMNLRALSEPIKSPLVQQGLEPLPGRRPPANRTQPAAERHSMT